MTSRGLIDVHTHVVPDHFPQNPSPQSNPRWPCLCMAGDQQATIEIAGKPFRQLDARSWQNARRVDDMDAAGIAAQVLSPMPELLSYWFSASDGLEMARFMNAVLAAMVAIHPKRFYALGMVPLQDVSLAARELSRLRDDGLCGIEIGSNINGVYLGDARFEEFWAEVERLDLAVFVHALHPVGSERLADFPDLVPFAGFPVDTALSAMTMIRAGIRERFPALRIAFSHGGGALGPLVSRLEQGWHVSDGFEGQLRQSPLEVASSFFYDSLVYEVDYLDYLFRSIALDQVFAGTDYPYAIMQKDVCSFVDRSKYCTVSDMNSAATRFLGVERNT